jgi:hypothetical protein
MHTPRLRSVQEHGATAAALLAACGQPAPLADPPTTNGTCPAFSRLGSDAVPSSVPADLPATAEVIGTSQPAALPAKPAPAATPEIGMMPTAETVQP